MGGGLLAAIASLATPILARILIALGIGAVTFTGVEASVGAVRSLVMNYLGAAPLAGLQLAGLAGVWVGLGMVFGSITFTLTLWSLTKAVRIVKG